jgi:hypothetical protein
VLWREPITGAAMLVGGGDGARVGRRGWTLPELEADGVGAGAEELEMEKEQERGWGTTVVEKERR